MNLIENIHNSALSIIVNDAISNCITNQITSIPQERKNNFIKELLDKLIQNIEFQYKSNNITEKFVLDNNLLNKISIEFANILVKFNYANKLTKKMDASYFANKNIIYNNMANKYFESYNEVKDIISNIYGLSNTTNLDDKLNAQLSLNATKTLFQEIYHESQNEDAFIKNFIDAYEGIYNNTKNDEHNTRGYNILNLNNEAIDIISTNATDIYIRNSSIKKDYNETKNIFINSINKTIEKNNKNNHSLPSDVLEDSTTHKR